MKRREPAPTHNAAMLAVIASPATAALIIARAERFLAKVDNLTTLEFSRGGEQKEREELRQALASFSSDPSVFPALGCEKGNGYRCACDECDRTAARSGARSK